MIFDRVWVRPTVYLSGWDIRLEGIMISLNLSFYHSRISCFPFICQLPNCPPPRWQHPKQKLIGSPFRSSGFLSIMPTHKPKKRASGHKSKPKKNRRHTSSITHRQTFSTPTSPGDPLV